MGIENKNAYLMMAVNGKVQMEALKKVKTILVTQPKPERSPYYDFSARVAARLKKEKKRGFWSDIVAISPKVAAACTALMIATLLGIYIREGNFSKEFIIGVENLTPEDAAIGIENEKITKNRTEKAMEMPKEKKRDSDNGRLH